MNDPAPMMNQPLQMMSQAPPPQMMSQSQVMKPVQVLVPSQAMNPAQSQQMMSHSQAMTQPPPQQQPMMMMNQRGYKPWPQQSSMDPIPNQFQIQNPFKFNSNFVPSKPRSKGNNWKGKNVGNKDQRRMEKPIPNMPPVHPNSLLTGGAAGGPSGGGYQPPSLNELQTQNRMKARKFYHSKKKFNNRFAPYAPRNTTSFIIRAKKAGGIASLVSPCPVTPSVLPTPIFSPSREVLGDMAKEEWGVDGYGSMKGLIRLRSPGNDADVHDEDDDEEGNGSSESDVEEHVEVERRLDHDLSRFEMIYPSYGGAGAGDYNYNNVLENRVDDQDTHIAQLEEENLTLKERLFLMERELGDLRRRMQCLERQQGRSAMVVEDVNEEVVENVSENDENENESDGGSDAAAATTGVETNEQVMEYVGGNEECKNISNDIKEINDVPMEENVPNNEANDVDGRPGGEHGEAGVATDAAAMIKENEAKGGEPGLVFSEKAEMSKNDRIEDDRRDRAVRDNMEAREDGS